MLRNMRLQHIRKWSLACKIFLSVCCCKNEEETNTAFLLKLGNFVVAHFSDSVANNLINFQVSRQWNNISFILNLSRASSLRFWHGEY